MTENLSIVARLSTETQLEHLDADDELERLLAEPNALAYRGWLVRQLGFHVPVEAALEATPHLTGIVGVRPRTKVGRLRSDLLALGIEPEQIAKIPPCPSVPTQFHSLARALGWMYVGERWTLQFYNVYRQLARALPGEVAFASSYLKCYEGNAGVMWRAFVAAVDASCTSEAAVIELVAGAHDGFRALRKYQPIARASAVAVSAASGARATRG